MSKSKQEKRISDDKYSTGSEIERSGKMFMRSMVPSGKKLRILDIGCGTGLNASYMVKNGHKVVGVDLSSVAIEKFKANGFEGYVADISESFPFPNKKFDLVYASEVIEHLADSDRFMKEVNRVLIDDGILLMSTINSAFWPFRILGLLGKTLTETQHPGHIRFFSRSGLKQLCIDAGFVVNQFSARNMYIVLPDYFGKILSSLLKRIGFQREFRFATKTYFWQASCFSKRASSFWSDTLIIKAQKRKT